MALVATARITHAGRIIEPGEPVPDGADADRLIRLGVAEETKPTPEKPKAPPARRRKAPT